MKIIAKTLNQEKYEIDIGDDTNGTLLDFKKGLAKSKNIPIDHIFKIIFNGILLTNEPNSDNKKLSEFKLVDKSIVIVMIKAPTVAKPIEPKTSPKPIRPTIQPFGTVRQQMHPSSIPSMTIPTTMQQLPSSQLMSSLTSFSGLLNEMTQNRSNMTTAMGSVNDDDEMPELEDVEPTSEENNDPEAINSQLQQTLQQNPQGFLTTLLSNPHIQGMYRDNPDAFMQIVSDPNFMQHVLTSPSAMSNGGTSIKLSEDEMKDVQELVGLGFSQSDVIQYYMACDKNKEATASMLFNDQLDNQQ